MIVVLDTNVIVSALLSPSGIPAVIINRWEVGEFDVIISPALLNELGQVLQYPRIQKVLNLSHEDLELFLNRTSQVAIVVEPDFKLSVIKDDPADNRLLECGIAGGADFIVSGDHHLLEVKDYRGIVILQPAGFLTVLDMK